MSITDLILDLVAKVCVVLVFIYLVTRTRYFTGILDKQFNIKNQIVLILIFGIFAIYSTYTGIKLPSGAIANIRDLGPIVAGLIGGPVIGLGAGLIGGVHRYFLGGLTQIPCSLATVIAGLAAGMIYKRQKGKFIGIWRATLFAILIESLHMGLILLISRPYSEALQVVKLISLPMILANAVGVAISALIVSNLIKERRAKDRQ
ncbi:MAG: ECF transporter S component [Dehalococcoidales bacterium]|nr:ECF transporter S component [Dehalococcoidales bacterium]